MKHRPHRTSWRNLALVAVVLVAVAAACSSRDADSTAPVGAPASGDVGQDFDGAETPAPSPEPPPAEAPGGVPSDPSDLGSGGVVLASLQSIDPTRNIIFRADLTVAVADVGASGAEATTVVESFGGFLFGQQTVGQPSPRSVLTFKIAPENFRAALAALGSIGELRSQNVSADDVTERIVDIESRIATAEASVERLRSFLENANDVETIAELERELLDRETTLETLRGQLRTLENQVALATIVLTLTEADIAPGIDLSVTTYPGHDGAGESCPADNESAYVAGDDVTVCFEIFNSGDTTLTALTLRDNVLDVDLGDLVVVFGDPASLEPGQSLLLAAEIVAARDLRTQTKVTAEPVNADTGATIEGRTVSATRSALVAVTDPGGLPGFGDGVSASWDLLQNIGGIAVLVGGAVLPFLWLVALAGIWWWLSRRRRASDETSPVPGGEPQAGENSAR